MRAVLLGLGLLLVVASPASAMYAGVSGGTVTPNPVQNGGPTGYQVGLTGKDVAADIVIAVDRTASMAESFDGTTRFDAVKSALGTFVDTLTQRGFFTAGGRVGVVVYGAASATRAALTDDVAAIKASLDPVAPNEADTCLACALDQARTMLSGTTTNRRVVYLIGDGENTSGDLPAAIAAADAAKIERRSMSIDHNPTDLKTADSTGDAPEPTTTSEIAAVLQADPTSFPGATNVTWTFHLTPGFTASSPSPGGTVVNGGKDVVWTIASLGATTPQTLTFSLLHDGKTCAFTAFSSTLFSDDQSDVAPNVGLAPVTIRDCGATPGGGGSTGDGNGGGGAQSPTPLSVTKVSFTRTTLNLTLNRAARIKLTFARSTPGRKVGKKCVGQTRANKRRPRCVRYIPAGSVTKNLAAGVQRVAAPKTLKPGTYKVAVTALNEGGKPLTIKTLTLRVPKKR